MSDLARYEEVSSELAFTSEVIAKQLLELKQISNELSKVDIATIKNAVIVYNEAIKSPVTNELKSYIAQALDLVKQTIEPRLNAIDNTKDRLEALNDRFNLIYSGYKAIAISVMLSLLFGATLGAISSYEWLIKGEKEEFNEKIAQLEASYPELNASYKLLADKDINLVVGEKLLSTYIIVQSAKGEAYTAQNGHLVIRVDGKK
jgi:hypothetical protein